MIIFTDDPTVSEIVGNRFNQPITILNLSSLYSGYDSITDLITKLSYANNTDLPMYEFIVSLNFDIQFANAVICDSNLFYMLMKIMVHCYAGYNVIILVQRDPYRDAVMESLIKLIQQRYGYNSWIVESYEDIDCLKENSFIPGGIETLDMDIKRYESMVSNGLVTPIIPMLNIE